MDQICVDCQENGTDTKYGTGSVNHRVKPEDPRTGPDDWTDLSWSNAVGKESPTDLVG